MGMSVDYVLTSALPTSTNQIIWAIESAQGATQDVPVSLDARRNLLTFADLKPEQGPFRSYLAIVQPDGRKLPISSKIDMRSPEL